MQSISGNIRKMLSEAKQPVEYALPIGDENLSLNQFIGKTLNLSYAGTINCIYCNRKISKSFNQGYCFPCFKKLARCDFCIIHPEKCHFHKGTCREPEWGEANCMQPHYVYLANTSGLKIGITRCVNVPTRWIDQGAIQALPIIEVQTRLQSGLIEVVFKEILNDRTNWRKMLQLEIEPIDLQEQQKVVIAEVKPNLQKIIDKYGDVAIKILTANQEYKFEYPIHAMPEKIKSLSFDKQDEIKGELLGIKGQYLILDCGVLNIRKHAGYDITFSY